MSAPAAEFARKPASARASPAARPRIAVRSSSARPQRMALGGRGGDAAEREAVAAARAVMRAGAPSLRERPGPGPQGAPAQGAAKRGAARPLRGPLPGLGGSGRPLPARVQAFMGPRFGADFGAVRLHDGPDAARLAAAQGARAFALGNNVYFGRGQFDPDSDRGRELIAHELAHTIQQGAVEQRPVLARTAVSLRTSTAIQRSLIDIDDVLDYFADKAQALPSFTILTYVLGMNPVNRREVNPSAAELLREGVKLIPLVGGKIAEALDRYKIFDKVAAWAKAQFKSLGLAGQAVYDSLVAFAERMLSGDILKVGLDGAWQQGKAIVTGVIDEIKRFAGGLLADFIAFLREAVLKPAAALVRDKTSGFDLLCAVLGHNPITGEETPPTPEALIGGFMKLCGREEVWKRIQETKAIGKVAAWFRDAVKTVTGFVKQLPDLALAALRSLEVEDFLILPNGIRKVLGVFGGFAKSFVAWGLDAAWKLLEIVFQAVSPGAWTYLQRTGGALKRILADPLPFVRNLAQAAKLGFQGFGGNFLNHLKAGLIQWLTGALPGVHIPAALTLSEIFKFVASVLGLTWANIRGKLVAAVGEPAVKALEAGFDIVRTLVREGPAAAWEKIREQLNNLKEMAIGAIQDFVVDAVVKKAVPKLVSLFIPGAGFVSAIVSIYDMVMVLKSRLQQIGQVAASFVEGIVAIANGQITPAAKRVEGILASLLSLAINFFAAFVNLGRVSDKIMEVINRIRAPIDKAIDWLVGWIVKAGKFVWEKGKAGVEKALDWLKEFMKPRTFRGGGGTHSAWFNEAGEPMLASKPQKAATALGQLRKDLPDIPTKQRPKAGQALGGSEQKLKPVEAASPKGKTAPTGDKLKRLRDLWDVFISSLPATYDAFPDSGTMPAEAFVFSTDLSRHPRKQWDMLRNDYKKQLKGQESGLNALKAGEWATNRERYLAVGRSELDRAGIEEYRAAVRKEAYDQHVKMMKKKTGRQTLTKAEIAEAEEVAAAKLKGQPILHNPDQIAGGSLLFPIEDPANIRQMEIKAGMGRTNSAIGSAWKNHAPQLKQLDDVAAKPENIRKKMNVKLSFVG